MKRDGFRALVRQDGRLLVRSRRGWDMTQLLPELDGLPRGVYDGELVGFEDGPVVPGRMPADPQPRHGVRLALMFFDFSPTVGGT